MTLKKTEHIKNFPVTISVSLEGRTGYGEESSRQCVCVFLGFAPAQADLMRDDSTPSVHSLVERSFSPYSSPKLRALGFRG